MRTMPMTFSTAFRTLVAQPFGNRSQGTVPIVFGPIVAQRESLLWNAFGVTQALHSTTRQKSCRTELGLSPLGGEPVGQRKGTVP